MAKGSLESAIRGIKRDAERMAKLIEAAERRSADTGVKIAKDFSSGRKSSAQLRREGHPFATRHGSPQDPPEVINTQRGDFKAAWKTLAKVVKGQSVPVVSNKSRVSDFLKKGTSKMFARPIDEAVGKTLEPIRMENLKRELSKLEK